MKLSPQTRYDMLVEIHSHFECVLQWLGTTINIHFSSQYVTKAEALIEIVEVSDCGSVGGFDESNPVEKTTGYELYDRFLALCQKKTELTLEVSDERKAINTKETTRRIKAVCGAAR